MPTLSKVSDTSGPAIKPIVGWILIAIWVALAFVVQYVPGVAGQIASGLQMLATLLFVTFLGAVIFGWRGMLLLWLITIIVANVTENLSIAFGFPYGFFYHTDAVPGPRIIAVPITVGISYYLYVMLGWAFADLVLGTDSSSSRWTGIIGRPLLAAIVASALDAVQDPIYATVQGIYVYPHGGGYFGVPLSNSLGWMVTVFIILFLFELWRSRLSRPASINASSVSGWKLQAPVLLGLNVLPMALSMLSKANAVVKDGTGMAWNSSAIYESTTLVGLHTLVFCMVIAVFIVLMRKKDTLQ